MRRVLCSIPIIALLAAVQFGIAGAAPERAGRAPAPLQFARSGMSGWSYSVGRLSDCEVADAAAVLKNVASTSIHVLSVKVVATGGDAVPEVHWGSELMTFRAGSTMGEVAGSFDLTALRNGHPSGPAVGGEVAPTSRSHRWYDVVVRSKVPDGAKRDWRIYGLIVGYRLGSHTYATEFKQSIILPRSKRCG